MVVLLTLLYTAIIILAALETNVLGTAGWEQKAGSMNINSHRRSSRRLETSGEVNEIDANLKAKPSKRFNNVKIILQDYSSNYGKAWPTQNSGSGGNNVPTQNGQNGGNNGNTWKPQNGPNNGNDSNTWPTLNGQSNGNSGSTWPIQNNGNNVLPQNGHNGWNGGNTLPPQNSNGVNGGDSVTSQNGPNDGNGSNLLPYQDKHGQKILIDIKVLSASSILTPYKNILLMASWILLGIVANFLAVLF